jgi:hypothetical protein
LKRKVVMQLIEIKQQKADDETAANNKNIVEFQ